MGYVVISFNWDLEGIVMTETMGVAIGTGKVLWGICGLHTVPDRKQEPSQFRTYGTAKSGGIDNRLLCEIATREDFVTLMTDTEIYVDGIATSHFRDFNSFLEVLRENVFSEYQPVGKIPHERHWKLRRCRKKIISVRSCTGFGMQSSIL